MTNLTPEQAFHEARKSRKVSHELEAIIADSNYWSYRYIMEFSKNIGKFSNVMREKMVDPEVVSKIVQDFLPEGVVVNLPVSDNEGDKEHFITCLLTAFYTLLASR